MYGFFCCLRVFHSWDSVGQLCCFWLVCTTNCPFSSFSPSGAGCQCGFVLQWLLYKSGGFWGSTVSEYSAYPCLLYSFLPLNYPPQLREVLLTVVWQLLAVTVLSLPCVCVCVCLDTSRSQCSCSPFCIASRYPSPFFRDWGRLQKSCFVWRVITY